MGSGLLEGQENIQLFFCSAVNPPGFQEKGQLCLAPLPALIIFPAMPPPCHTQGYGAYRIRAGLAACNPSLPAKLPRPRPPWPCGTCLHQQLSSRSQGSPGRWWVWCVSESGVELALQQQDGIWTRVSSEAL